MIFFDIPRMIATSNLDHNAYSMGHLLPRRNLLDFSLREFLHGVATDSLTAWRIFIRWATESARDANIQLIYSGSYCGCIVERTGQLGRVDQTARLQKAIPSPARQRRRSLYKFHESFEPYIFSLSSRFARHVLLKYDNFTRVGRPPASRLVFFFFHGPPRHARFSSALVYSISAQTRFISALPPWPLALLFVILDVTMYANFVNYARSLQSSLLSILARIVSNF